MLENYGELITLDQLQEILSIGRNTAYDLLRTKKIKAIKIGKLCRIPKKSIEDYITDIMEFH